MKSILDNCKGEIYKLDIDWNLIEYDDLKEEKYLTLGVK
jgi:hypothetical protein